MFDTILFKSGARPYFWSLVVKSRTSPIVSRLITSRMTSSVRSWPKVVSCQSPKLIRHVGNGGDMNAAVGSLLLSYVYTAIAGIYLKPGRRPALFADKLHLPRYIGDFRVVIVLSSSTRPSLALTSAVICQPPSHRRWAESVKYA